MEVMVEVMVEMVSTKNTKVQQKQGGGRKRKKKIQKNYEKKKKVEKIKLIRKRENEEKK